MRHPFHPSFRIPAAFVALRAYVLDGVEEMSVDGLSVDDVAWRKVGSFFCGDLTGSLLHPESAYGDPHGELGYQSQPVEIVPFCRNGGDGLHYGWAVLAPELDLDDQPCVSFAPGESACWLGDTTKQALENLLVGDVARYETGPTSADDPRWPAMCAALDLHPHLGSPDITPGARSKRRLRPPVPPGWRFEPTPDGLGVLAEESAFSPGPVELHDEWDAEERLATGRRLLADGHPASAVEVLKGKGPEHEDMLVMRDAYRVLGRDLHVERAEIWLDRN